MGYHDVRIAQDVRQGVEVGFGRGNLREYLAWVERELEGGERKGEGLFTSWGFDVSRVSLSSLFGCKSIYRAVTDILERLSRSFRF